MFKRLCAWLLHPVVVWPIGLILLFAVVFVGGRILVDVERDWKTTALNETDVVLLQVYGVLAAVLVFAYVISRYRALKRALQLEKDIREQGESVARARHGNDTAAVRKQFTEALAALKASRLGKSALHALPWYVIIGPPASGKTTMLSKSGLNFPYTIQGSKVRGIGGTRNCDWWFTDQGILLDTAGRYTTASEDRNEWLAFLDLLRRSRKHMPINGAVVSISMEDILDASEERLAEHAGRIRERLGELTNRLDLVFPVYLVFTKCDLLEGFVETFRDLSREERAQVWGCTIPMGRTDEAVVQDVFADEMDALYDRLCSHRLSLMTTERSWEDTHRIYSFPAKFAAARDQLTHFVRLLVQPNPYHEGSDLRGFYFTSGTQESEVVDEVLGALDAGGEEEVDDDRITAVPLESKSYFIDDLFQKVVFPDSGLARSSTHAARRRALLRRVAVVGSIAATLALTVLLFMSFVRHSDVIVKCRETVAEDEDLKSAYRTDAPAKLTLAQKKDLEELRERYERLATPRSWGMDWWLDFYPLSRRLPDLRDTVRGIYCDSLRLVFLGRCATTLEGRLKVQAPLVAGRTPPANGPVVRAREAALTGSGGSGGNGVNGNPPALLPPRVAVLFSQQFRLYEMLCGEDPQPMVFQRLFEEPGNRDLWRWPGEAAAATAGGGDPAPAEEHPASRHRNTFLKFAITGGDKSDWVTPRDSALMARAKSKMVRETPLGLVEMAKGKSSSSLRDLLVARFPRLPAERLDGLQVDRVLISDAFRDVDALERAQTLLRQNLDTLPLVRRQRDAWKVECRVALYEKCATAWKSVLRKLAPNDLRNVLDAAKNLERHTRPGSAYELTYKLVREKLGFLDQKYGGLPPVSNNARTPSWLRGALDDLREIKTKAFTDLPKVNGLRAIGSVRGEDKGAVIWNLLSNLEAQWRKARQKIADAQDDPASEELRPHVRVAMDNLRGSIRRALIAEVDAEAREFWNDEVGRELKTLSAKYPFAKPGASLEDLPIAVFSEMFRGKSKDGSDGKFARAYRILEAFTVSHGAVPPLVSFSDEFRDNGRQAERIRKALFAANEATPSVTFFVAMQNAGRDIASTEIEFAGQRIRTLDWRPQTLRRRPWTWKPQLGRAALTLRVIVADVQKQLAKEERSSAWSLFRLIEGLETSRSTRQNELICEWKFTRGPNMSPSPAKFGLRTDGVNPFVPGFFRRFKFDTQRVFHPVHPK